MATNCAFVVIARRGSNTHLKSLKVEACFSFAVAHWASNTHKNQLV